MKNTILFLLLAVLFLVTTVYLVGGTNLVITSLSVAWQTAGRAFLLILIAFIVIGQLQVLITSEMIKKWLDRYSGYKSIVASALAGGLFPGGPYIFYPFLAGFKDKGIPFYMLFSFVVGKQGYDLTRLPLEISLTTPGLAILRNVVTLPVPLIMGLITWRLFPAGFDKPAKEGGDGK